MRTAVAAEDRFSWGSDIPADEPEDFAGNVHGCARVGGDVGVRDACGVEDGVQLGGSIQVPGQLGRLFEVPIAEPAGEDGRSACRRGSLHVKTRGVSGRSLPGTHGSHQQQGSRHGLRLTRGGRHGSP